MKVDADGQAELERRLQEANWKPEGTYVLEHGYCRSLYTEDPNGMLLEFTVDVPEADEIAIERASRRPRDVEPLARRGPHREQPVPVSIPAVT